VDGENDDIDGAPLEDNEEMEEEDDDIDGVPLEASKWDDDDDELQVKTVPVSVSGSDKDPAEREEKKTEKQIIDETRRGLLRQLEIQVQQYADALEVKGLAKEQLDAELAQYRAKLTKQLEEGTFQPSPLLTEKIKDEERKSARSDIRTGRDQERKRRNKNSGSSSESMSRSRSRSREEKRWRSPEERKKRDKKSKH